MKLLVGLGNPGSEYAATRHNAGFMLIDRLAAEAGVTLRHESKLAAMVGDARLDGERVILAEPTTYMNLSGEAVTKLLNWYKLDLPDLLVLYDDFAFPLGTLRLRKDGSSGGHNGIASIIQHLRTPQFDRLRLGIGPMPPGRKMIDFVLGRFTPEERPILEKAVNLGAEATRCVIRHGIDRAMTDYNGCKVVL